ICFWASSHFLGQALGMLRKRKSKSRRKGRASRFSPTSSDTRPVYPLTCDREINNWPATSNSRSQALLGNAPPRSSASHPRATASSYSRRPLGKQSFPDLRSQAELGNEARGA